MQDKAKRNASIQTKDSALTKTPADGHTVSEHRDSARQHDDSINNDRASNDRINNDSTHDGIVDVMLADDDGHSVTREPGEHETNKSTKTFQETVIGTRYASDAKHGDHHHEDIHHNEYNVMSTEAATERKTTVNKGTATFKEGVVDSKHVNDNDNPARQPDRRDQGGNAFDDGINEHTTAGESSKSDELNNMNRYASIDNAQTRVLNPDEKDQ